MTAIPRLDMPAENGRPTLKWGRQVTESVAGSRIISPDHFVQETPAGTLLKHKRPFRGSAADVTLPFINIFEQLTDTSGTWKAGKSYLAGVDTTVAGLPTTITGITTSTKYWIKHDFAAATLTWGSGATLPANTDSEEYYLMLDVTCTASAIESFVCPHPAEIHATAKST